MMRGGEAEKPSTSTVGEVLDELLQRGVAAHQTAEPRRYIRQLGGAHRIKHNAAAPAKLISAAQRGRNDLFLSLRTPPQRHRRTTTKTTTKTQAPSSPTSSTQQQPSSPCVDEDAKMAKKKRLFASRRCAEMPTLAASARHRSMEEENRIATSPTTTQMNPLPNTRTSATSAAVVGTSTTTTTTTANTRWRRRTTRAKRCASAAGLTKAATLFELWGRKSLEHTSSSSQQQQQQEKCGAHRRRRRLLRRDVVEHLHDMRTMPDEVRRRCNAPRLVQHCEDVLRQGVWSSALTVLQHRANFIQALHQGLQATTTPTPTPSSACLLSANVARSFPLFGAIVEVSWLYDPSSITRGVVLHESAQRLGVLVMSVEVEQQLRAYMHEEKHATMMMKTEPVVVNVRTRFPGSSGSWADVVALHSSSSLSSSTLEQMPVLIYAGELVGDAPALHSLRGRCL